MGVSSGDEDGGGVDGDDSGGNSPSRRRAGTEILSPETCLRDGGGYGTLRGISSIDVGFSRREEYIGERAARGGAWGAHPIGRRAPLLGRAPVWCGGPGPPLRLPFGVLVRLGEIRCLAFVSSNSENIARTVFLEPKTAENRNWHFGTLLIG